MFRNLQRRCILCFLQKINISIADTITTGTTMATARTAFFFFFDDLELHGSPFAVSYLKPRKTYLSGWIQWIITVY